MSCCVDLEAPLVPGGNSSQEPSRAQSVEASEQDSAGQLRICCIRWPRRKMLPSFACMACLECSLGPTPVCLGSRKSVPVLVTCVCSQGEPLPMRCGNAHLFCCRRCVTVAEFAGQGQRQPCPGRTLDGRGWSCPSAGGGSGGLSARCLVSADTQSCANA